MGDFDVNDVLQEIEEDMAAQYQVDSISHLRDVDMAEQKSFVGLLIYTSIFKSNHENVDTIFATDGTGRDIFRAVMSRNRFLVLLVALRFEDPETRS
nr:unnamed protein product [Callosobruchus chinensis]